MIKPVSSFGLSHTKNNQKIEANSPLQKGYSNKNINFTGGSTDIVSILSYFVTDVVAIAVACGLVAQHFFNKGQKLAKDLD